MSPDGNVVEVVFLHVERRLNFEQSPSVPSAPLEDVSRLVSLQISPERRYPPARKPSGQCAIQSAFCVE